MSLPQCQLQIFDDSYKYIHYYKFSIIFFANIAITELEI